MKDIKINDQSYPFRLTMWSLEKLLTQEGYSFSTIGNYLQEHMVEGVYKIVVLGMNMAQRYGHTDTPKDYIEYTVEAIDEMISMDMKQFGTLADFIGTYLGVTSDTNIESDPK